MPTPEEVLHQTEAYVRHFFLEKVPAKYVFHDAEHTAQMVGAVRKLSQGHKLSAPDQYLLTLAAWFHDTGYDQGPDNHEQRSAEYASVYFADILDASQIEIVKKCIYATKLPQKPQNLLEQIICDADLSHLGKDSYWDRNSKIRQEFNYSRNLVMSDHEWVDFEIQFMMNHDYHTSGAKELYNKKKAKHIQQLLKQKKRLNPDAAFTEAEIAVMAKKDQNSDLLSMIYETEGKNVRTGRGVETMYRTTYRTHTSLSQMADSKANLMLSVNAIVISILVSNLIPKLHENHKLIIPTAILTLVCLGSMVYATLSTRPKITEGSITREAIKQRKANLLFFGNFYNMPLEDFQWGVNEMLNDPEFLYSSMSRDLYFLGIVLAKKYRYLSICYNVFMYGIILSVIAFGVCMWS